MILFLGESQAGGVADRLLRALAARGHEHMPVQPRRLFEDLKGESRACMTAYRDRGMRVGILIPSPGQEADLLRTCELLRVLKFDLVFDWLVVTRLGAHPDARSPRLRACWRLEEEVRGWRGRTLTLRLGPLLGPSSPLWRHLAGGPALPRRGAKLVNPVAEDDVVETLARALDGRAAWEGWYEVAGPETWTLAELAELARASGAPRGGPGAGWEPPLAEIEEHRLAEADPWLGHFGLEPRPLAGRAAAWAAAAAGRVA